MDEYSGLDFEIITEGYFGNTTTYTVWLWENGKAPVSAIMYIWNSGDMVYRVEKEIICLYHRSHVDVRAINLNLLR